MPPLQSRHVLADGTRRAKSCVDTRRRRRDRGVAVDAKHFYAVSNSTIAKYDKRSGERVGRRGKATRTTFPHINSCTVIKVETVRSWCARTRTSRRCRSGAVSSSSIRRHFVTCAASRSARVVARSPGSSDATAPGGPLFANYDGKGGEAPRDHRHTVLIRFDDEWRQTQSWSFPASVLERFVPMSSSGGGWGPDGRLYVTGHDHPELYILELPEAGAVLEHVGTISRTDRRPAIDWDESAPGELYGISRSGREIVRMKIPGAVRGR